METGTKLIAHKGMGSDMEIFLKHGYGDGHNGTFSNAYPLPSLLGSISNLLLRTPLMCWMMSQHVHLCIIYKASLLNIVEVLLLPSFKRKLFDKK